MISLVDTWEDNCYGVMYTSYTCTQLLHNTKNSCKLQNSRYPPFIFGRMSMVHGTWFRFFLRTLNTLLSYWYSDNTELHSLWYSHRQPVEVVISWLIYTFTHADFYILKVTWPLMMWTFTFCYSYVIERHTVVFTATNHSLKPYLCKL